MTCQTCADIRRDQIDLAIISGRSVRKIAQQFPPLTYTQIHRHKKHISALMQAAQTEHGNRLAQEVRGLIEEAHRLRQLAEKKNDIRAAIRCLDTALRAVELYGRASGELNDRRGGDVTVNIAMPSPAEAVAEAAELLMLFAGEADLMRVSEQLRARAEELHCAVIVQ